MRAPHARRDRVCAAHLRRLERVVSGEVDLELEAAAGVRRVALRAVRASSASRTDAEVLPVNGDLGGAQEGGGGSNIAAAWAGVLNPGLRSVPTPWSALRRAAFGTTRPGGDGGAACSARAKLREAQSGAAAGRRGRCCWARTGPMIVASHANRSEFC